MALRMPTSTHARIHHGRTLPSGPLACRPRSWSALASPLPQYPEDPCGATLCGDWRMKVATARGLGWL